MQKILITGITGFAGSFLAEHLSLDKNVEIHGTYLSDSSTKNVSALQDAIYLHKVDLQLADEVGRLIGLTKPDCIFHFAALSSAAKSFTQSTSTVLSNIEIQMNILNAVQDQKLYNCRILVTSSAEVYGLVQEKDLPIDEDTPLRPVSPYAVSKIAQDYLALQYFLAYKLPIIRVRPFNHIGPRQIPDFVVASFAKQIADIEKGITEPVLHVGNLDSKRDFTDVRDMVKAYAGIMQKGKVGDVYNIGSGVSHKIGDILEILLSLSDKNITISIDKKLLRPGDVSDIRCNTHKLESVISWKPKITLEQTLKDTLDYWRTYQVEN